MFDTTKLSFTPLEKRYAKTLYSWFEKPHVQEFYYADGLQNTLDNIALTLEGKNHNGCYSFYHWIGLYDNKPFAFLMTSPVAGPYNPDNIYDKWYEEGKETFTLDLLIGEEEYLGKGLAVPMIQNFIVNQYAHAEKFIIDPETANKKAIRVYEKAGFTVVDEVVPDFNPKPHTMLMLRASTLLE